MDFEWDDYNRNHVQEAGLEPDDAEEALIDADRLTTDAHNVRGERRWAILGATEQGRVLFVVFTRRGERIRVVTARDADKGEKRRYRIGGK